MSYLILIGILIASYWGFKFMMNSLNESTSYTPQKTINVRAEFAKALSKSIESHGFTSVEKAVEMIIEKNEIFKQALSDVLNDGFIIVGEENHVEPELERRLYDNPKFRHPIYIQIETAVFQQGNNDHSISSYNRKAYLKDSGNGELNILINALISTKPDFDELENVREEMIRICLPYKSMIGRVNYLDDLFGNVPSKLTNLLLQPIEGKSIQKVVLALFFVPIYLSDGYVKKRGAKITSSVNDPSRWFMAPSLSLTLDEMITRFDKESPLYDPKNVSKI